VNAPLTTSENNAPSTTYEKVVHHPIWKAMVRFAQMAFVLLVFSIIVDTMTSEEGKTTLDAMQKEVTAALKLIQPWTLGKQFFNAARRVYGNQQLLDGKPMLIKGRPLSEKDISILKGKGETSVEGQNEIQGISILVAFDTFETPEEEHSKRWLELQKVFGTDEDAWHEANQLLLLHQWYNTSINNSLTASIWRYVFLSDTILGVVVVDMFSGLSQFETLVVGAPIIVGCLSLIIFIDFASNLVGLALLIFFAPLLVLFVAGLTSAPLYVLLYLSQYLLLAFVKLASFFIGVGMWSFYFLQYVKKCFDLAFHAIAKSVHE
jgi:hypothetical protein